MRLRMPSSSAVTSVSSSVTPSQKYRLGSRNRNADHIARDVWHHHRADGIVYHCSHFDGDIPRMPACHQPSVEAAKTSFRPADEIANGQFNTALPVIDSHDEIHKLRDSFENRPQLSLTEYIEKLKSTTAAKASIESELEDYRDIQMSMLPKTCPAFPRAPRCGHLRTGDAPRKGCRRQDLLRLLYPQDNKAYLLHRRCVGQKCSAS